MNKVLVLHGPNLNLLGTREPEIYGHTTLDNINNMLKEQAEKAHIGIDFFQTNHEGIIVDRIQQSAGYDYIILNAAAFTHYSVAIRDAIAGVAVPVIEVHLSNIHKREEFRHNSVIAPVAEGQISGLGVGSYQAALYYIITKLNGVVNNEK
ncbi:type II 3-dehydroquinate dehydratase [Pectinatus sottacetonis]|uniref:type II 3-dehydroquinate dehydratase n=1 Tax=Pectinatus sottacetonis TaxID=1002795 RepID=UPI0018C4B267|nr:type II 3-dehydroquinate dehydratase [Pectinatus sottacetonis]